MSFSHISNRSLDVSFQEVVHLVRTVVRKQTRTLRMLIIDKFESRERRAHDPTNPMPNATLYMYSSLAYKDPLLQHDWGLLGRKYDQRAIRRQYRSWDRASIDARSG